MSAAARPVRGRPSWRWAWRQAPRWTRGDPVTRLLHVAGVRWWRLAASVTTLHPSPMGSWLVGHVSHSGAATQWEAWKYGGGTFRLQWIGRGRTRTLCVLWRPQVLFQDDLTTGDRTPVGRAWWGPWTALADVDRVRRAGWWWVRALYALRRAPASWPRWTEREATT